MDCRDFQNELTDGIPIDPGLLRHLEDCPECRAFADDLAWLRKLGVETGAPPTPQRLRQSTLLQCRSLLADGESDRARGWRGLWRHMRSQPSSLAVGALLATGILGSLMVYLVEDSGSDQAAFFLKLLAVQFILQNMVAATFLPALATLIKRTGYRLPVPAMTGETT